MKEQILECRVRGMSYREIQQKLGCSKGTIAYHLGVGQKDRAQHRQRDRRSAIRKFLQEAKCKPCADCGESYPYWIMQFDHIRGKSFQLSSSANCRTIDEIKDEVSKCEVVCANCHHNRTFTRRLKDGADVDWERCKQFDN